MRMLQTKNLFYASILFYSISVLISSCTQPCSLPAYTNQALDTISLEDVVKLQENLEVWTSKCPEFKEGNNVWFSIESLTNYLSYAQHTASQMQNTPEISGIRIYFGKNDANELRVVASATYTPTTNPPAEKANDPDIGFGALNYGSAGMPPKKDYPHTN